MARNQHLTKALNLLRMHGVVSSQKELAALLGYSESALSNAMKGDGQYCSETLLLKVDALVRKETGIDLSAEDASAPASNTTENGVFLPRETLEMYNNLTESVRLLSEMLNRYQTADALQKKDNAGASLYPKL